MLHKRLLLSLAAVLLIQPSAWGLIPADPVTISITVVGNPANSLSGLGEFTAQLTYDANGSTQATLTVQITNTTPFAGGYITAFALNNPNILITNISIVDDDLELLGGPGFQDGVDAGPFGLFDFGVSTGGGFEGDGDPSLAGLGVGETGQVVFSLTGANLNSLDVLDFVNTLATQGSEFMVVRFRGLNSSQLQGEGDGTDTVPAMLAPEPGSLMLGVLGLGLILPAWRRRMHS